ncbi:unnamed protein product [Ambrosiozyma monospora]|uniref:Unnamed protein product n=1 Tax=Ambrosiozyma monospora TaxID=43982 RepID=A0A9W6Z2N6_AMBMO|nr:unnamed protein product [Ambrosiozyma monospora]
MSGRYFAGRGVYEKPESSSSESGSDTDTETESDDHQQHLDNKLPIRSIQLKESSFSGTNTNETIENREEITIRNQNRQNARVRNLASIHKKKNSNGRVRSDSEDENDYSSDSSSNDDTSDSDDDSESSDDSEGDRQKKRPTVPIKFISKKRRKTVSGTTSTIGNVTEYKKSTYDNEKDKAKVKSINEIERQINRLNQEDMKMRESFEGDKDDGLNGGGNDDDENIDHEKDYDNWKKREFARLSKERVMLIKRELAREVMEDKRRGVYGLW